MPALASADLESSPGASESADLAFRGPGLAFGWGALLGLFFGGGSSYCCWVLIFDIACQISLTPRHVDAENGRGSLSGV